MEREITRTEAFDIAYRFATETNQNIFLTGKAGTGKTTFLRHLRSECVKNMVVAAPTGVAAINAGGVTIHSLFQLPFAPYIPVRPGLDRMHEHPLLGQVKLHRAKLDLLRKLELLIIDEASMVPSHTVDAIDVILKSVRRNHRAPFGGVQVLFIGDLHQLPPVVKNEEREQLQQHYRSSFFFDSHILTQAPPVTIELTRIFRQQDDRFVTLLNGIRDNTLRPEDLELLNSRLNPEGPADRTGYITLTTHNHQADRINSRELEQIKGKKFLFKAEVQGDFPEHMFPASANLELKEGAQVMFLKNDTEQQRFFNGKIGVITYISDDEIVVGCEGNDKINVPKMEWKNLRFQTNKTTGEITEELLGTFSQFPLRLAWAVTIHKSQGLTFDKLIVDAENAFSNGQVYVALSRCTTLDGLILTTPVNQRFLGAHRELVEWKERNRDEEPPEARLDLARQQFILGELLSVFQWRSLSNAFSSLHDGVKLLVFELGVPKLDWCLNMQQTLSENLGIAQRFQGQLQQIWNQHPDLNANEMLRERVKEAVSYFLPRLRKWRAELYVHPLSTDKKGVAKEIDPPLQETDLIAQEILHKLQACEAGFDLDNWLKKGKRFPEFKPQVPPAYARTQVAAGGASGHQELYERLAELRKQIASESGVALFQVFNNKAIEGVCERLPGTPQSLLLVKGFGKTKVKQFGEEVLEVVADYCRDAGIETDQFSPEEEVEKPKHQVAKGSTVDVSIGLLREGLSIDDVARQRSLTVGTIYNHITKAIRAGVATLSEFMSDERQQQIRALLPDNASSLSLSQVKEQVGETVSWEELRLFAVGE